MGTEVCNLIGLFLLNDLNKIIKSKHFVLYRDDGLVVINKSKWERERITKKLRSIFNDHGFRITIENIYFRLIFFEYLHELEK